MNTQVSPTSRFSDLLDVDAAGRPRLPASVHPIPELLEMDTEQVLARFKHDQINDFEHVIRDLEDPANPLFRMFDELRVIAEHDPGNRFGSVALFKKGALRAMFLDLHEHVMSHPVWRHPFFVRMFEGRFNQQQLERFALNYFNQVKNTRQCVALALGRFNGVMPMEYGCLNERVSELTQIVLAQLIADEYGVGSHSVEDYPSMSTLFATTTHPVMYRKMFEGLQIPFEQQDKPLLHGVADNVLIQRIVAGHPVFTTQEALASVGLGMEWGVPEFFTLLLGGMIRFAWKNNVPLTSHHLEVFIAHVRFDVLHAIAVMLVTSFHAEDDKAVERIKGATNMLMAGRYGMMTDLYRFVFDEGCPALTEIGLDARYHLHDRRIENELRKARTEADPRRVVEGEAYRRSESMPFVFAPGV